MSPCNEHLLPQAPSLVMGRPELAVEDIPDTGQPQSILPTTTSNATIGNRVTLPLLIKAFSRHLRGLVCHGLAFLEIYEALFGKLAYPCGRCQAQNTPGSKRQAALSPNRGGKVFV